jgi:hypothetical protein
MSKETITVFISSRFGEFAILRKLIAEKRFCSLVEIGLEINMLDYRNNIADYRPPVMASIEETVNSNIFILLLGETYGESPVNNDISYTHLEYDTAISIGMKILAFPIGDCYNPIKEKLSDIPMFRQWQESVLRSSIHTTAPFTPTNHDVNELYSKIYSSLKELIKQIIHRHAESNYEPCPYDVKRFHKKQSLIVKTMLDKLDETSRNHLKNKLFMEYNGDVEIHFPTLILTDDEIRVSDVMSDVEDTNEVNKHFINVLKEKCSKRLWNNPTYRLLEIVSGKLVLGQSNFYKTLSTCDIHYYNFMKANFQRLEDNRDFITWLNQLQKIVVHNHFSDISASVGCSTLLVVKNYLKNIFQYYIVNTSKTKNGDNTKHVIPSFMFQPTKMVNGNDDFKLQSNIVFQVLKEFGEELLGMEELEKINDYQALYYKIKANTVINRLIQLMNDGKAELKILGVSLDIFRLRPEILTVLIVDDEKFDELFSINRKLSWEASTEDMNGLHIIDIDDQEKYLDLIFDNNEPLVSPALACLKLGREYVLKNYQHSVSVSDKRGLT